MDRRVLLTIAVVVPLLFAGYGMYRVSEDRGEAQTSRNAGEEPRVAPSASLAPEDAARMKRLQEWTLDDEIAWRASEVNAADRLTRLVTALTQVRATPAAGSSTVGSMPASPLANRG